MGNKTAAAGERYLCSFCLRLFGFYPNHRLMRVSLSHIWLYFGKINLMCLIHYHPWILKTMTGPVSAFVVWEKILALVWWHLAVKLASRVCLCSEYQITIMRAKLPSALCQCMLLLQRAKIHCTENHLTCCGVLKSVQSEFQFWGSKGAHYLKWPVSIS